MLAVVGISVGIAAVAFHSLWERYDEFVEYFFQSLTQQEQVALLALIFAVMFAAVGISGLSGGSKEGSNPDEDNQLSLFSNSSKVPSYPLHELNQALSDRAKFACLYPWLRDSILDCMKDTNEIPESALEYLSRMMDYTVMGGKFNRGTTVVNVYRAIQKRTLSAKEIAQAATLGWTIELLQAFFLVADDVMDESESRRDKPCWYQVDDVQLQAINDAFLLESFVFSIAKQHFSHLPCYTTILELLLDVIQKTELGQMLDLTSHQRSSTAVDFEKFTVERYGLIVRYKTAYYSFYLPVALAMSLAGIKDAQTYRIAKEICGIMGEYFQSQSDMIDCFGDSRGGTGMDIQENKCTWLIVQALDRGSDKQRQILEDNYAKDDQECVKRVKAIYRDLRLETAFLAYQEQSYAEIQKLMGQVKGMPSNVFEILLKKVYKRAKKYGSV